MSTRTDSKPKNKNYAESPNIRSLNSFPLFQHQVAGHGHIRSFRPGLVIKPLVMTEAQFYSFLNPSKSILFSPATFSQASPSSSPITSPNQQLTLVLEKTRCPQPELLDFIPSFHGFLTLRASEQIKPLPELSLQLSTPQESNSIPTTNNNLNLGSNNNLNPGFNNKPASPPPAPSNPPTTSPSITQDQPQQPSPQQPSPQQPQQQQFPHHIQITDLAKRFRQQPKTDSLFLILGEMNYGLRNPCMLDLKMGTRLHGVHATPEKAKRSKAKCLHSTLAETGIRVDGMKVFNLTSNTYITTTKSFGHLLTTTTLPSAFHLFLCSNSPIPISLINTTNSNNTNSNIINVNNNCNSNFITVTHPANLSLDSTATSPLAATTTTMPNSTTTEALSHARIELVSSLLAQLYTLKQIVSSLAGYRFFSCSLLLLYDANAPASTARVKIVDFAKTVFVNENGDLSGGCDDPAALLVGSGGGSGGGDETSSSIGQQQQQPALLGEKGRAKSNSSSDFMNLTVPDMGFLLGLQTVINILEDIKKSCGEHCASEHS
eukprot:c26192_g1_i1.p1 GENE.c26192_g1_i1~~c26192_g1_i1.p1  ORF type:complete len:624 (+),score=174.67 c26192_g1_i1:235-1872(+)